MGKTASLANIGTIADSSLGFRNRLINGAMVIDQRNAGAAVTPTNGSYTLDRWSGNVTAASKFTVEQTVTGVAAPTGFTDYLAVTSSSAYSVGAGDAFTVYQAIEGLNIADLAWGTASAATVTLSFWVRSSLTGTFGGSIRNSTAARSYPFSYTISAANTWEQKSITIAGDTSGTWLTTNGIGLILGFSLGTGSTFSGTAGAWAGSNLISATGATSVVGTNSATFYITGVQLEKGSTATSFDYRPYGTELALCQRYFWNGSVFPSFTASTVRDGGNFATMPMQNPVQMRVTPTATTTGTWQYYSNANAWTNGAQNSLVTSSTLFNTIGVDIGTNAEPTLGTSWFLRINGGTFSLSSEL